MISLPLSFPLFMTRKWKVPVGWFIALVAPAMYLAPNWVSILPPQQLPMMWLDRVIPFWPLSVWIYISEYFFFFTVYVTSQDMANLNKWFYSFMSLQTVSVIIFWLWPTVYPRELFPLVREQTDALTYYAFTGLRMLDSPANCCPSLHVSSVFLSTFIYLDEQRKKFPYFFIWGTLIALSTLPTKQHYVVDVITGFGMAVLFYYIFHVLIQYRPLQKLEFQANR